MARGVEFWPSLLSGVELWPGGVELWPSGVELWPGGIELWLSGVELWPGGVELWPSCELSDGFLGFPAGCLYVAAYRYSAPTSQSADLISSVYVAALPVSMLT